MKVHYKICLVILLILTFIGQTCKKVEVPNLPAVPFVKTLEITGITGTEAKCGGKITYEGESTVTERGVCWSTDIDPSLEDNKTIDGAGTGSFTSILSDLEGVTTYYVRAYAINNAGTGYGMTMSFKTFGDAPGIVAQSAKKITSNSAILNGTIIASFLTTDVTFEYGTTTSYGISLTSSQNPIIGNVNSVVTANISGLIPETTYHFRIKAVNSRGATYGSDMSFKTFPSGVPMDGLVAYFTFSGGKALNLSNSDDDGIISGAVPSPDRFSRPNESFQFYFHIADAFIIVRNPGFIDNNAGTIATWVKFDNLWNAQYVASAGDTNSVDNYLSFIRLDNIAHTFGIYHQAPSVSNWVNGTTVISPDVYYHVVVTSDGFMWSIYINGVKEVLAVIRGSNNGKWINSIPGVDNFVVGNLKTKEPHLQPHFSGIIDEVLVYNKALSEDEVFNLYNLILNKK